MKTTDKIKSNVGATAYTDTAIGEQLLWLLQQI